jgi:Xaa-Pro dipeptidase
MPIVAGSVRASTLHYCCNDKELAWGPVLASTCHGDQSLANGHAHGDGCAGPRELHPQVLLIDAGCEWDCYASDSQ